MHPQLVSYASKASKANREKSIPDNGFQDTFEEFWWARGSQPILKGTNRLALFSTCTQTWVGKLVSQWDSLPWHCWGAAVLFPLTGYGKHFIIFDVNADMDQDFDTLRPSTLEAPIQEKLIKFVRSTGKVTIWYGNADPPGRQMLSTNDSLD